MAPERFWTSVNTKCTMQLCLKVLHTSLARLLGTPTILQEYFLYFWKDKPSCEGCVLSLPLQTSKPTKTYVGHFYCTSCAISCYHCWDQGITKAMVRHSLLTRW